MDKQDPLHQFITQCQSRLVFKRRLAGFCLFVLISLWCSELALFSGTLKASLYSNLLMILSVLGIVTSVVHIYRRFGPSEDPAALETSAFLDRCLDSGSLVESTWEAHEKRVTPAPLLAQLKTQTLQRLAASTPSALVPIRVPRGFQLGLALAALFALFLFTGPLKDLASTRARSASLSLLSNDETPLEIIAGSEKDSDATIEKWIQFQNKKALPNPQNSQSSDPGNSVKVEEGTKNKGPESKHSDSKVSPDKAEVDPDKSDKNPPAHSGSAESSGGQSGDKQAKENPDKSGSQDSSKDSTTLAEAFKGDGRGAVKKVTDLGTQRTTFVLNTEQLNRRLAGAKVELSWSMKQTLRKYFQQLNEEKQ